MSNYSLDRANRKEYAYGEMAFKSNIWCALISTCRDPFLAVNLQLFHRSVPLEKVPESEYRLWTCFKW